MGQQAMEADVDAEGAKDVDTDNRKNNAGPAEEPGQEGQQPDKVKSDDADWIYQSICDECWTSTRSPAE